MNAKERKLLKRQLDELTLKQLVALATQKSDLSYPIVRHTPRGELIDFLMTIENVLKPEKS